MENGCTGIRLYILSPVGRSYAGREVQFPGYLEGSRVPIKLNKVQNDPRNTFKWTESRFMMVLGPPFVSKGR